MRTVNLFGAVILALATSAWSFGAVAQTAAPDTTAAPPADTSTPPAKKPVHHKASAAKKAAPTPAGDKAVDDLNAESLDAAKANKTFTPPAAPAPAKPAKATKATHHKKVAKKAAPAEAAAPPADTSK